MGVKLQTQKELGPPYMHDHNTLTMTANTTLPSTIRIKNPAAVRRSHPKNSRRVAPATHLAPQEDFDTLHSLAVVLGRPTHQANVTNLQTSRRDKEANDEKGKQGSCWPLRLIPKCG